MGDAASGEVPVDGPETGPDVPRAAIVERPPTAPRLRPVGAIQRAAEIAIWGEAKEALSAVARYAEDAREWVREALEAERARGYAEGRQAGAEDAARLQAETALRAAAHLNALELELPALVHRVVAEILGEFGAEEVITRSVRRAVAALRPDADAILRVSPDDADAVGAALADLASRATLRIEADPALGPGEASLRTALGSVEVGLDAQLRALRAGLGASSAGTDGYPGGTRDAA